MATKDELLNQVQKKYSVISIEEKGKTARDKIQEYDLWYNDNGIVKYRRLHIFEDENGNTYWYGENPIPQTTEPVETFDTKVRNKAKDVISKNENIKHIKIDDIDTIMERATATVYVDVSGVIKEKMAVIYKNQDNTISFEILE